MHRIDDQHYWPIVCNALRTPSYRMVSEKLVDNGGSVVAVVLDSVECILFGIDQRPLSDVSCNAADCRRYMQEQEITF